MTTEPLIGCESFRAFPDQENVRCAFHDAPRDGNCRQEIVQTRHATGSELTAVHPCRIQLNLPGAVWQSAQTNRINPAIHLHRNDTLFDRVQQELLWGNGRTRAAAMDGPVTPRRVDGIPSARPRRCEKRFHG